MHRHALYRRFRQATHAQYFMQRALQFLGMEGKEVKLVLGNRLADSPSLESVLPFFLDDEDGRQIMYFSSCGSRNGTLLSN